MKTERRRRDVPLFWLLTLSCVGLLIFCSITNCTLALATASSAGGPGLSTPQSQPTNLSVTTDTAPRQTRRYPHHFLMNQGQADSRVMFQAQARGAGIFLTSSGLVLAWTRTKADGAGAVTSSLHLELVGGSPSTKLEGLEELSGKANSFLGQDHQRWIVGIPTFKKVAYREVYAGTDFIFYGNDQNLEYDIVLAPGADPRRVKLAFRGAEGVVLNVEGDLVVRIGEEQILQRRPVVYQEINGQKRRLRADYVLQGKEEVGITVEGFDPTQALVIDPVLVFSSYLGGSNQEYGEAIAVDAAGNVYLTGHTVSTMDFPVTPGSYQTTYNGGKEDVFVVKMAPGGNETVYATYLGGDQEESGFGIAVDAQGKAFVTGRTCSTNFPTTTKAFQIRHGGGTGSFCGDAFVTKLNAAGDSLVYSTLLGGGSEDAGYGIAVDATGRAFVVGDSNSTKGDTGFPTTPEVLDDNCSSDAFVAKLNQDGSALLYATCLGSSGLDHGEGIALDVNGNAYVAGNICSGDFPATSGAFQTTYGGGYSDAFVAKLNSAGTALIYATFLGGDNSDWASGIAVDADGFAFVTGTTHSAVGFPTTPGAFLSSYGGLGDAFVAKLNKGGSKLIYSSFLGGDEHDIGEGIALDNKGNAYIVGETLTIPIARFPTTPDAFQSEGMYGFELFVTKINKTATALLYSTLVAGEEADFARGIAVDAAGNAYITGETLSATSFPTTAGAFQQVYGGSTDAFVAKLQLGKTFRTLTVTTPNTAVVWEAGTTKTIRWTYTGDLGPEVRLELLKGWNEPKIIASGTAIGTAGAGSFSWKIPLTLPPGTDYRIQITSTTHPEYTDISNDSFTIRPAPAISVTAPNGGEIWEAGTAQTIRWTYEGNTGGSVKIELVAAGAVVSNITSSTLIGKGGIGSFKYTMPSSQPPGDNYKVFITSTTKAGCKDTSNNNFKISAPSAPGLAVVSPNGGEKWVPGGTQTIRWTYAGNPGESVKLLLMKGSKVARTLAKSNPLGSWGKGSFLWTVPLDPAPGKDYAIKIVSTTLATCSDRSNRNFSISAVPAIILDAPNGGEVWAGGELQEIRWRYLENDNSTLAIHLLKGGEVSRVITEFAPIGDSGEGRFLWTPPCDLESGNTYKIKLVSSDGNHTDASNSNFTLESGPKITVTSPNGGEIWEAGTWVSRFTWAYTCAPDPAVKIELLKDGQVKTIVDSEIDTGGDGIGESSFHIGYDYATGNDFRVRITSVTLPDVYGISLNDFSIVAEQHKPNVVPYRWPDWQDKLVLSRQLGTHTDDDQFSTNDSIYADWAVCNEGTADIETTFSVTLYVDGIRRNSWSYDSLKEMCCASWSDYNLGKLSAGKHTIKLMADANDTLAEGSESDNKYAKVIEVREAVGPNLHFYTPSGWSDRIVVSNKTGTNTDDSLLLSNVDLYLDFAHMNNGPVAINNSYSVHLYVDGNMSKSFQFNPPLNPNYYITRVDQSLGKLSGGQHTILLVLDATGVINEFNEFDNTLSRMITVKAAVGPNLTPYKPASWSNKIVISTKTGTRTDDNPLTTDDTLYLDWAVINNGTEAAEAKFHVGLYVDSQFVKSWTRETPLSPTYYWYSSDYVVGKLSAGSHTIKLIADTTRLQPEYNESDNEYTRTITVTQAAAVNLTPYKAAGWSDPIVVSRQTGTTIDDGPLYETDTLYLDWAIINNGGMATAESFSVSLLVDGNPTQSWQVNPPLNAGYWTWHYDHPLGTLSTGSHTLQLVVDSTEAIPESNESDNEYTKTITIMDPAPNLTPYQPSGWSDKIVVAGQSGTNVDAAWLYNNESLYVDWAVINKGVLAVTDFYSVALYLDGNETSTWQLDPPLNADYYRSVKDYAIGLLSAGTHTLKVVVDTTGSIEEGSETDNEYTKTINVLDATGANLRFFHPDGWSGALVLSKTAGTQTDDSPLTTGDSLFLDFAFENNGSEAISGSFDVALYVDDNLTETWSRTQPLDTGFYIPFSDVALGQLAEGTHSIKIVLDSTTTISEFNESDNEFTKTFTIEPN